MNTHDEIPLTPGMIEHLKSERKRTQTGLVALYDNYIAHHPERPLALSAQDLCRWLVGASDTVPIDHFDFVCAAYKRLPNRGRKSGEIAFAPFSRSMLEALRSEAERPQLTPYALRKNAEHIGLAIPSTRFTDKIYQWLRGEVQKVEKSAFDQILNLYKAMPTVTYRFMEMTTVQRERLSNEMQRTGLGPKGLLNLARAEGFEKPRTLSAHMIKAWRSGETKRLRDDHYEWVLSVLEQLPNDVIRSRGHLRSKTKDRDNIEVIISVVLKD